jgi:hypothetical protein
LQAAGLMLMNPPRQPSPPPPTIQTTTCRPTGMTVTCNTF